jgi:ABC-2 type transport system permease protein
VSGFTGTGSLLRLAFRTDRVRMPVWVLVLTMQAVSQVAGVVAQYPTQADLDRLARAVEATGTNPALVALTGPAYEPSTLGGLTAWQVVTLQTALIGLMCILLVTRHTRTEEETGRAELIHALPVGRYALPAAALLYVLLVNVLLAVLSVLGYVGYGLPLASSVALAVGPGLGGMVFAAVGLLAVQLTDHARTANGIAGGVLGLAFLLRAVGDSAAASDPGSWLRWLTWLSPIGWIEELRPFAGERWWLLTLPLVLFLATLAGVAALIRHRDVGAGMLPQRQGPADAPPGLRSPLALAWRLQRGSMLGWTIAIFITGASFGGLAKDMQAFADSDPNISKTMAQLTGGHGSIADLYLAAIYAWIGATVAIYAVQAVLRLRSEESEHRAEPILATAVGRVPWALSHVVWALAGSVVVTAAGGLGAGLAHGLRTGDLATQVPRQIGAALAQVPAVWLLAGVGLLMFGLVPRLAAPVAWGVLGVAVFISTLGGLLNLDQLVLDLSPFTHLPRLPGGDVTLAPFAWLAGVAAVLVAAGLAGFRRRDLSPGS